MSEITKEYSTLTKHPAGSLKELATISIPLMLSILSGNLMMFFDRLILAKYAIEAMNAVVAASMVAAIFQMGATGVASIAEVFVGQYNGEKNYPKASSPTWQMIWFSLFLFPLFVLLAQFTGPYLLTDFYYHEYAYPYYQWILLFGSTFAIQSAISAFFVGIGHVKLVTFATIAANVVNVLLDLLLIFGVDPLIPPLSTKGAAIATGLSQVVQILILLIPFFSKKIRNTYHTTDFSFCTPLFLKCLRIGIPSAAAHMIEIGAWALLVAIATTRGDEFITAIAVSMSSYGLISFGMQGLQQGVTTLSANFMGAKLWGKVQKTWWSAVRFLFIMAALFIAVILLYPDPIINSFITDDLNPHSRLELFQLIQNIFLLVWVYFIFDGLAWISAGVLTAAGDTLFVMLMNGISAWLFAVIPTYIAVIYFNGTAITYWIMVCFYGMMNALLFYLRYQSGSWKEKAITS